MSTQTGIQKSRTTLLVVDDDAQLLSALQRGLKLRGYVVHAASGVEEAIGALRVLTVDVLLTDLRMGERTGMELLAHVREQSPRTRCMLMSGDASPDERDTALELGAVRVLLKPFCHDELDDAIRLALGPAGLR